MVRNVFAISGTIRMYLPQDWKMRQQKKSAVIELNTIKMKTISLSPGRLHNGTRCLQVFFLPFEASICVNRFSILIVQGKYGRLVLGHFTVVGESGSYSQITCSEIIFPMQRCKKISRKFTFPRINQ